MDNNFDCDIRFDKYGQPDVNYYINEAKRLRAVAISEFFHTTTEWLKTHLIKNAAKFVAHPRGKHSAA